MYGKRRGHFHAVALSASTFQPRGEQRAVSRLHNDDLFKGLPCNKAIAPPRTPLPCARRCVCDGRDGGALCYTVIYHQSGTKMEIHVLDRSTYGEKYLGSEAFPLIMALNSDTVLPCFEAFWSGHGFKMLFGTFVVKQPWHRAPCTSLLQVPSLSKTVQAYILY